MLELPLAIQNWVRQLRGAFFVIDSGGLVLFWSDGAEQLLGHRSKDVVGHRCYEVLAGLDMFDNPCCVPDCAVLQVCRRDGTVRPHEIQLQGADGSYKRVTCTVTVLQNQRTHRPILVYHLHEGGLRPEVAPPPALDETPRVPRDTPRPPQRDTPAPRPSALHELTRREQDMLRRLAAGQDPQVMAQELSISPTTVRNHIQNMLRKLGVHSRVEAVALAYRNGWL